MSEALKVVKYDVNEAAIGEMGKIYLNLTIDGIEDEEGFKQVHDAEQIMVKHRTGITKLRLGANETAQAYIKKNNAEAKALIDLMAPIESHLKSQKKAVTDEQARIKEEADKAEQERIQSMTDALSAVECVMPFYDVAGLGYEEFANVLYSAQGLYGEERTHEIEAAKAETERLAQEQADREAEDQRLAEERAELVHLRIAQKEYERIAQEKADRIAAEQQVAQERIDAERKALDDEKKAEQERLDRIEFEKMAKERAEEEAKAKAELEAELAKEAAERELAEAERGASLAPDKDKLFAWADEILGMVAPDVSDPKAEELALGCLTQIFDAAEFMQKYAEAL